MVYEEATFWPGALAGLDRSYRLRDLPERLVGETFLRAGNDDADPKRGTALALTLTLCNDSTVFLADDARGEVLPTWARGIFEPTQACLKVSSIGFALLFQQQRAVKAGKKTGLVDENVQ